MVNAGIETVNAIVGIPYKTIEQKMLSMGNTAFRAKQLWKWVYGKGVSDFDSMSNLSKQFRSELTDLYSLERLIFTEEQISNDGTRKWLVRFSDGNEAETVFIPENNRGTLCVSSQIGCTLTCKFCHTGTQRLVRNLDSSEIVGQLMMARDRLQDWPSSKPDQKITNIVMMGMGEPLFNYDNVVDALRIFMHEDGLTLSKRRVTLSTSGLVPKIKQLAHDIDVSLAISLHAVTDDVRNVLVPLNKKYPIPELLKACHYYLEHGLNRRITFEYVMLKGINDSDEDAKKLVELLATIDAKVNLIPFNSWPGSIYECSSNNRIRSFSQILMDAGYPSPVRTPRGQDILAACGQLKSASER